jgi:hypothetical protein
MIKSAENMEKMRTSVRTDCHLGIRLQMKELNVDNEMVRQILTTNLNMQKCVPK